MEADTATPMLEEKTSLKTAALELPPCKVCGGKASGIHYGVNSCEACKGFFRRFLSRKEPYICSKSGNCVISDRPRGNCSACRMQKCLELGMSKDAVRQGRYTLSERTKAIMEVKQLHESQEEKEEEKFDYQDVLYDTTLTLGEVSIEGQGQEVSSSNSVTYITLPVSLAANTSALCHSTAGQALEQTDSGISVLDGDGAAQVLNMESASTEPDSDQEKEETLQSILPQMLKCLEDLSPFQSKMTDEEISKLLSNASNNFAKKEEMFGKMEPIPAEEFNKIYKATGLDVDGRMERIQRMKPFIEVVVRQLVKFAKIIPGFTDLVLEDQSALVKACRFEFCMILNHRCVDPDNDVAIDTFSGEIVHINEVSSYIPKGLMTMMWEFTKTIKKLDLSTEEMALVLATSLLFTDRCKLLEPEKVESVQLNTLSLLRYLLKKHHGSLESRAFSRIMSMFSSMRTLEKDYSIEYRKMCADEHLREQLPELLEFLYDEETEEM